MTASADGTPRGLEPEEVWSYLLDRGLVPAGSTGTAREVGDGNMNRVFVTVPDAPDGRSLAVKQAPPWINVLGPDAPMSPERALIEARALRVFASYAPEQTPEVLDVDPDRFAFTMEDLSGFTVLRTALTEGARFGTTSQQVGDLVGQVTFATSVAGMGARDRARLLADSVNPLLAEVTEKYLLSDPFVETPDNRHRAELDALVAELRADDRIRTAVSRLRVAFGSNAQGLVHGDLHSGSVMVADCGGQTRVRVIDPEFAVVGPIGLDLGLYLGNVLLAALRARALGEQERALEHADQVRQCWAAFAGAWTARWPDRVDVFLDDGWLRQHLSSVWDDSLGFAAVEIVRRIAAYSHAADIETLPDPVPASAAALRIARRLLLSPASLHLADGQPDPVAVGALVAEELP